MRSILLICAAICMTMAVSAESRIEGCTVNLEKDSANGFGFVFISEFIEIGPNACSRAFSACEGIKVVQRDSYLYRCTKQQPIIIPPTPMRPSRPNITNCDYQIETPEGFTDHFFSADGPNACAKAKKKCDIGLLQQRIGAMIFGDAWCTKVFGPITNLPPRTREPVVVSVTCIVDLVAGRMSRPTGNFFTATAEGVTHGEARSWACQLAHDDCQAHVRGAMRCEERL